MNALTIRNLRKTYRAADKKEGGFEALKGIDLDVAEGDFYALLGPNGAGKTTTIGIITSLITKSSGSVKIFDIDIDHDFPAAKRFFGVVPQEFNFSIFEKVEDIVLQQAGYYGIGRKEAAKRAEYYLQRLGLWDKRGVQARELSGGMKRRLMIVRGLIHEPKLLILDEPTAGVDVELRRGMWDFVQELNNAGSTIILTTHYLEEAEQLCNRIGIINGGRLIEDTDKRELLHKLDYETLLFESRAPVESVPPLQGIDCIIQKNGTTLEMKKPKEISLNTVFAHFTQHNIEIDGMRNKSNRLEELFMELVEK